MTPQKYNLQDHIKRLAKIFLGLPLTLLSLFFIFRFIYVSRSEILTQFSSFNLLLFVLGLVFLSIFFLLRAFVWVKLLEQNGSFYSFRKGAHLFLSAEIRRYIPGSVFAFVSRVHHFEDENISKKRIIKLLFHESAIFLIASFIVSIPIIIFFLNSTSTFELLKFASGIYTTVFLGLAAFLFLGLFTIAFKFFLKQISIQSWTKFIDLILLSILGWVFFGLGNLLITASIMSLNANLVLEFISLFVFSWLVGYLFFIVPMGLGIREAVLTFGLSYFIPIPIAASISVVLRVGMIITEILTLGATSFFAKAKNKLFLRISTYQMILSTSIVSYISYFTYLSFERHMNFFTGRFDLGNMDQTVWNTINERIFTLTNPDGTNIISRLGIHADFMLILLSPLYLIWEDPKMLLFVQSLVLSLGAVFVYLIGKKILNDKLLSIIFAMAYLLNPFLQRQNLFDFHAVTLATTFLLATFYFFLSKRHYYAFLFLTLAVLTKENVYLVAILLGLYAFYISSKKIWLIVSFSFLLIFYFLVSKFIPQARGSEHFAISYFENFGATPLEIVKNIILNPYTTASTLFSVSNFEYLYKLFLPLGFLSFLSPLYLVFVMPELAINIFSQNENLKSINFHYGALIIPFVYISAMYSVDKLLQGKNLFLKRKITIYYLIFFIVFSSWFYGVLPGSRSPNIEIFTKGKENRHQIKEYLNSIPSNLSVATTNNLGSHLSHREKIYVLPNGAGNADMILFLFETHDSKDGLLFMESILANKNYRLVYNTDGFFSFEKQ